MPSKPVSEKCQPSESQNQTTPPHAPSRTKTPTLQPRHAIIPQPVLRQHSPDRAPQDLPSSPLLHHALHGDLLQAARPRRVRVVLLLLHLLAGRVQLRQPRADDVVAAVRAGVVDRLVLAHEREGDGGGQAAERARVAAGVDEVPGARVGEAGLGGVRGLLYVGIIVSGMYLADELGHGGGCGCPVGRKGDSVESPGAQMCLTEVPVVS